MSDKQFTDISPQKLFDVLQKEYLICILREQIYPKQKHKEYWHKISLMKQDKIYDLKWKYKLISIFDDELILKDYKLRSYNEYGLPNFYYPNEKIKEQQVYWDIRNYFSIGAKVKGYKFNESNIKEVNYFLSTLVVDLYPNESLSFNEVSRIL